MAKIKIELMVVGGANMDIKAKAGATLIARSSNPGTVKVSPGGVGRNIAHNLARLGVKTGLITAIGNDVHGREIVTRARAAGIDVSMMITTAEPTGTYVATLDHMGELSVAVNDMAGTARLTVAMLKHRHDRLENANLVVADCNIPEDTLQFLTRYRSKLIVEPVSVAKCVKMKGLGPILAATPNRLQAETLTGIPVRSIADARKAAAALHAMGIAKVMIGLDAEGCIISEAEGEMLHVPIHQIEIGETRDATGGGDAAVAGFAYGLLKGLPLDQIGELAQAAAALAFASPDSVPEQLSLERAMDLARPRFRSAS